MNKLFKVTLLAFITIPNLSNGQSLWSEAKSTSNERKEISISTRQSKFYNLDLPKLADNLSSNQTTIEVPLPNGDFAQFTLEESGVMSKELKEKYPDIKAYKGKSLNNKYSGRFDITSKGFHGMFQSAEGTIFIDPINLNSKSEYQVYYKKDFIASKEGFSNDDVLNDKQSVALRTEAKSNQSSERSSGTELRTYSIAISTTGEYTQFHGGTVPDALSAIVTTMNRVTGIYESEVAISFELVGNTDLLIFTDPNTDPYTNGSASSFINEVQAEIDNILGAGTYDVGHGFSTGAGGLAGPGPCISGGNARGVTGTSTPIGDPYDVDYVAHEIGHQFGANHTFNGTSGSCTGGNRNSSTAYEPGSGTTILAYAGICSPQNIQNNSDPYFHSASYDEILAYSVDGSGNNCPTITSTGNTPPDVYAGEGGFTIPANTPFKLMGSASDPDGDELTFAWEQHDLGPAGHPNSPSGNAPLFRSFSPTTNRTRYFPQLSDIINNTQTLGEILPDYDRSLSFRFIARDNADGGGGVNYDNLLFNVTTEAGPFIINSFNTTTEVEAKNNVEVTWDVANTNLSPVNCKYVNILLSEDGGLTYPHVLRSNTLNDGSELVLIPDIITTRARIMIEAVDNAFFDINNIDFLINEPTKPDYNLSLDNSSIVICGEESKEIEISVGSILGYSENVTLTLEGLTDGINAEFSQNIVAPGNKSILTINNPDLTADGTYYLDLIANYGVSERRLNLVLDIYDGEPDILNILSPENGETEVATSGTVVWNDIRGSFLYFGELATDEAFTNIISGYNSSAGGLFTYSNLEESTTYYVRVKSFGGCEDSDYSVSSFTTGTPSCTTLESTDVPITIESVGTQQIVSELMMNSEGPISDINVIGLQGTHTYISDLIVQILSPSSAGATLFSQICDDQDDFNINFDSGASVGSIPCPPTDGGTYQPQTSLDALNGLEAYGIWQLRISDVFDQDGGSLDAWGLEICTIGNGKTLPPSNLTAGSSNDSVVILNWHDNSRSETGFSIERSTNNNTNFSEIATVGAGVTTYSDATISVSDSYYYRIIALSTTNSNPSNEESISFFPFAPANLNLSNITANSLTLNWTDNNNDEEGVVLERLENGVFLEIAILTPNTTSYTDDSLEPGTYYSYRIKNFKGTLESDYSAILIGRTLSLPPANPTNLTAEIEGLDQINLTWNDNSNNEENYVIERSIQNNLNYVVIATLESESTIFEDINLNLDNEYFYRVKAINSGGSSGYSNEVSALLLPLPPASPTNLIAEAIDLSQISLSWVDVADNEDNYIVERSVGENNNYVEIASISANSTSFDDDNLGELTEYFYRIKAINTGGESDFSNEASASTLVLSVSNNLADEVIISPNPFEGILNIELNENKQEVDLIIYDSRGQKIVAPKVVANSKISVDLSSYPNGIYLIRLSSASETQIFKVIKSNFN
ncbi:reprolysin-like metallopeptidase [Fulvivirga lutea]|uniref:T9SS type A sorting domain-containing protein n=1 Tax=Fulvivirga lutea TaxID=2810512 RepID=A0A974WGJ8_9BACT|nr:zinc-dependent metalloprotease family protein [Fulvivirga lutea]QSE97268.1 T9SS type A sorting domain-containing protein [Fulvivirga lutea]